MRIFSALPGLAVCIALGIGFAGGFLNPRVDLDPAADSLLASWSTPPAPSDYSGSRERIAFDLAGLALFGKPPADAVADAAAAPEEQPLKLVAIARLNGSAFALIDEGKPLPVRLSAGQQTSTGWRITGITEQDVTLEKNGSGQTLSLFPVTP